MASSVSESSVVRLRESGFDMALLGHVGMRVTEVECRWVYVGSNQGGLQAREEVVGTMNTVRCNH